MSSTVTVRDIDPADKAWLKREARQVGVSMEEFIRRLIREKRSKAEGRTTPSETFSRHFGPEHEVELPAPRRYAYRKVEFAGEDGGSQDGSRPRILPCPSGI